MHSFELSAAMKKLLKAICWKVISIYKDKLNKVGVAVFQKTSSNECYEQRSEKEPPLCKDSDDPNASWYDLFDKFLYFFVSLCLMERYARHANFLISIINLSLLYPNV